MTPVAPILDQSAVKQHMERIESIGHAIIICGHYEGIDERIFELFDITPISIGHYVLSSGELASMVFIDSMVRLIPGVITDASHEEDSFSEKFS